MSEDSGLPSIHTCMPIHASGQPHTDGCYHAEIATLRGSLQGARDEVDALRAQLSAATERAARLERERDEYLRIGKGFEEDSRKFFEQSCKNLARAEAAEASAAKWEQVAKDNTAVAMDRAAWEDEAQRQKKRAERLAKEVVALQEIADAAWLAIHRTFEHGSLVYDDCEYGHLRNLLTAMGYRGLPVRRPDGSPLVAPWDALLPREERGGSPFVDLSKDAKTTFVLNDAGEKVSAAEFAKTIDPEPSGKEKVVTYHLEKCATPAPEGFEGWHRRECPGKVPPEVTCNGHPWIGGGDRWDRRTCREVYAAEHPTPPEDPEKARALLARDVAQEAIEEQLRKGAKGGARDEALEDLLVAVAKQLAMLPREGSGRLATIAHYDPEPIALRKAFDDYCALKGQS